MLPSNGQIVPDDSLEIENEFNETNGRCHMGQLTPSEKLVINCQKKPKHEENLP